MEMRVIYYLHRVAGFHLSASEALTPFDILKVAASSAANS
jgi:hypothetical protein